MKPPRYNLYFRHRQDRRSTAIHEAAHAVIGRLLGIPGGEVSIVRDLAEGTEGYGVTATPWEVLTIWERHERWRHEAVVFRSRIVTYAAGREAEEEILGRCRGGDGDDLRQIDYMLDSLGLPDDVLVVNAARLRKRARSLVRRHRVTIEQVADVLLAKGKLTAEEMNGLVRLGGSFWDRETEVDALEAPAEVSLCAYAGVKLRKQGVSIPPESIAIGRCYLTAEGTIRKVTSTDSEGRVRFRERVGAGLLSTTTKKRRRHVFTAEALREVPCDWTPDADEV